MIRRRQDTPTPPEASAPLEVRGLSVEFHTPAGTVHAVNDASYSVQRRETLAVVGESGSGKSVTAQAVMGLLDPAIAHVTAGEILYRGANVLAMSERRRRKLRGATISLIPQDAMAALDPLVPVGRQIAEMFTTHRGWSRRQGLREAVTLMERVGIPSPERRVKDLPHQFSGGMRQRLVIAIGIALSPEVLIADEVTSALDVSTQIQVTALLSRLKDELAMSLIFITHDLLAIRGFADRVVVMYAGRVIEYGPVETVFAEPAHPYTEALLLSTPRIGDFATRLQAIPGRPPGLHRLLPGCPFAPRCRYRREICVDEPPPTKLLGSGRASACLFAPDYAHVEEVEES